MFSGINHVIRHNKTMKTIRRFIDWTGHFESNLSAAEWAWRIFTFVVVASGGTTAAFLAAGSELFGQAGYFAWFGIGVATCLVLAIIYLLIKVGQREAAETEYFRGISTNSSGINPLLDSFVDQVIYIHDLYLPGKQAHANKQFKRCKFVGPGALAILGGTYDHCGFFETGTAVVLPEGSYLTGIVALQNCTVEQCEFYRVTLFTTGPVGKAFADAGMQVVGL